MANVEYEIRAGYEDKARRGIEQTIAALQKLGNVQTQATKRQQEAARAQEALRKTQAAGLRLMRTTTIAFAAATAAAAGYVAVLGRVAKGVIDVGAKIERYEASLRVLLKSQDKANKAFAIFREFATTTPFALEEINAAGVSLLSFGFNLSEVNGLLTDAGDLAATFGVSLADVANVFGRLQGGQMGEAFERLRALGINRSKLEAAGLTFTTGGQVEQSAEQAITAVRKVIQDNFGGMQDEIAKTWDGTMSMLRDAWFNFKAEIAESGFFDYMREQLQGVLQEVNRLAESGQLEKWAEQLSDSLTRGFKAIQAQIAKVDFSKLIGQLGWLFDKTVDVGTALVEFGAKVITFARENEELVKVIGGVAVAGTVIFVLASFATQMATVVAGIGTLVTALGTITIAAAAPAVAIGGLTTALGLVAGGLMEIERRRMTAEMMKELERQVSGGTPQYLPGQAPAKVGAPGGTFQAPEGYTPFLAPEQIVVPGTVEAVNEVEAAVVDFMATTEHATEVMELFTRIPKLADMSASFDAAKDSVEEFETNTVDAIQTIMDVERDLAVSVMDHWDKRKAAAEDAYNERITQLNILRATGDITEAKFNQLADLAKKGYEKAGEEIEKLQEKANRQELVQPIKLLFSGDYSQVESSSDFAFAAFGQVINRLKDVSPAAGVAVEGIQGVISGFVSGGVWGAAAAGVSFLVSAVSLFGRETESLTEKIEKATAAVHERARAEIEAAKGPVSEFEGTVEAFSVLDLDQMRAVIDTQTAEVSKIIQGRAMSMAVNFANAYAPPEAITKAERAEIRLTEFKRLMDNVREVEASLDPVQSARLTEEKKLLATYNQVYRTTRDLETVTGEIASVASEQMKSQEASLARAGAYATWYQARYADIAELEKNAGEAVGIQQMAQVASRQAIARTTEKEVAENKRIADILKDNEGIVSDQLFSLQTSARTLDLIQEEEERRQEILTQQGGIWSEQLVAQRSSVKTIKDQNAENERLLDVLENNEGVFADQLQSFQNSKRILEQISAEEQRRQDILNQVGGIWSEQLVTQRNSVKVLRDLATEEERLHGILYDNKGVIGTQLVALELSRKDLEAQNREHTRINEILYNNAGLISDQLEAMGRSSAFLAWQKATQGLGDLFDNVFSQVDLPNFSPEILAQMEAMRRLSNQVEIDHIMEASRLRIKAINDSYNLEKRIMTRSLRMRFDLEEMALRQKYAGEFRAAGGSSVYQQMALGRAMTAIEALGARERAETTYASGLIEADRMAALEVAWDEVFDFGDPLVIEDWNDIFNSLRAADIPVDDWMDVFDILDTAKIPLDFWNDVIDMFSAVPIELEEWADAIDVLQAHEIGMEYWSDIVNVLGAAEIPVTAWSGVFDILNAAEIPITDWGVVIAALSTATKYTVDDWGPILDVMNATAYPITDWGTIITALNATEYGITDWGTIISALGASAYPVADWGAILSTMGATAYPITDWEPILTALGAAKLPIEDWALIVSVMTAAAIPIGSWATIVDALAAAKVPLASWEGVFSTLATAAIPIEAWSDVVTSLGAAAIPLESWGLVVNTMTAATIPIESWAGVFESLGAHEIPLADWGVVFSTLAANDIPISDWGTVIDTEGAALLNPNWSDIIDPQGFYPVDWGDFIHSTGKYTVDPQGFYPVDWGDFIHSTGKYTVDLATALDVTGVRDVDLATALEASGVMDVDMATALGVTGVKDIDLSTALQATGTYTVDLNDYFRVIPPTGMSFTPAIGAQHGFDGWVKRPTLFLTGEGGEAEHVRVTPRRHYDEGSKETETPIVINVTAWDGKSVERWFRTKGKKLLKDLMDLRHN